MTLPDAVQLDAMLTGERPVGDGLRMVEVAVDAAGGRSGTYTYAVPPELDDLLPGEAVLVDFGRRQALGIIVAETDRAANR